MHDDACHTPAGQDTQGRLRVWIEVLTLAAMAAFLAYSFFSGRVRWFVAPAYVWLSPAAVVLLAAMALARAAGWWRRAAAPCACAGEHQGVQIPAMACAAVLLASIVLAILVHPTQYSSEGVRKRRLVSRPRDAELAAAMRWIWDAGTVQASPAGKAPVLPRNPTVLDLIRAASGEDRAALEGQFVTVIGQCDVRDGPTAPRLEIYRMVVTCCVADATSVSIEVARTDTKTLEARVWVSVKGILRFDSPLDPGLPVIHAASISEISEPAAPYL